MFIVDWSGSCSRFSKKGDFLLTYKDLEFSCNFNWGCFESSPVVHPPGGFFLLKQDTDITNTYNARMTSELVHRQRLEDIKEKSSLACLQWRISKNVDAITSGSEGSKGRKEHTSEHLCCPVQWSGYEQTVGKQITKSCWWGTKGDGKLAVETGEEKVFVIWCLKTLLNCVLKVYGKQNLYIMNLNICRFLNKWLKAHLSFFFFFFGVVGLACFLFCFGICSRVWNEDKLKKELLGKNKWFQEILSSPECKNTLSLYEQD